MTMQYPVADVAATEFNEQYRQEPWWGGSKVEFDRNTGEYYIRVWIDNKADPKLPEKTESGVRIEVVRKHVRPVGRL
jgi:hypothetical protein